MGWRVAVLTAKDKEIWARRARLGTGFSNTWLREYCASADFRDAELMLDAQQNPESRLKIYTGPRPVWVRGR